MKEVDFWTDQLLTIGQIDSTKQGPDGVGFTEFHLEEGTAIGWTVYRDDYIHVIRAFLSKGAVFPLHEHQLSAENLILYKGAIDVYCGDDECYELEVGKALHLEAGRNHKLVSLVDSWVMTTLIPPDEELK
jgi:quercetin dioxygenase-like cupin family protein